MAEGLRRRSSKWDVVAEPQVPIVQTNDPSMKADEDIVTNSVWNASKIDANTLSPPSEVKADFTMKNNEKVEEDKSREWPQREDSNVRLSNTSSPSPRFPKLPDVDTGDGDYMKHSYREPLSGNHATGKDGDFNRTGNRWNKSLEQNYGTSLSPRRDGWRQQSPPISPKRNWSRSHRSRSRSRNRSRSRSRSPSYGFRRGPERSRSRSRSPRYGSRRGPERWPGRMGGGEAVACRDFAAGRCQRGSECRFLHEESSRRPSNRYYDSGRSETWESRAERRRFSGQDVRENFTESREQSDYPRDRFSRNDRPTNRCYDFIKGRCQRGSECRYAHDDVSYGARDESRARTRDGRDVDTSLGRRPDPPRRGVSDTPCKFFAEGRCRHGETCTFSHQVAGSQFHRSAYNMQIDSSNSSWKGQSQGDQPFASTWKGWNQGAQPVVIGTRNSSWECRNQGDQPVVINTSNPSPWTVNDNDSKTDVSRLKTQHSQSEVPESNIHQIQPQEASNPLAVASIPGQTFGHAGLDQYTASQPIQTPSFTPNVQIHQLVPPMTLNGQMQPAIFSLPQNVQGQFIAPQVPSINAPMQNLPVLPPFHIGLSQQNYNLPIPSHSGQNQPNVNLSGQIQQNFPLPLFNGQNQPSLNFSGQCHQTLPPPQDVQNQNVGSQPPNPESLSLNEQLMQTADTLEKQPSQLNSDTPKAVTSEQAVQITNLSASLAQFFGSASALNPQIATGMVPLVQPNQGSLTQQQANLTSGNMEPINPDANNLPPGFEQKDPTIQGAQNNIDSSAPLSVIGGTNYGDPPTKSVDLEVKVTQGNEGFAAKEVNETENIHSKKEQAEDVEADGRADDDDSKQSKDVKAMRIFKCALVDFVKDALKPSWKEGHLSKEAHKAIVKKVVDKVTGAMQSQSIPQTQEKIDIYMSHSKGKLTKLVQAYVEKYVKG